MKEELGVEREGGLPRGRSRGEGSITEPLGVRGVRGVRGDGVGVGVPAPTVELACKKKENFVSFLISFFFVSSFLWSK